MKVKTENDNNFGYEKITIVVDNMPLSFDLTKETLSENLKEITGQTMYLYPDGRIK